MSKLFPEHILVLGAGPAGAASALGLKRLGYRVTLLGTVRDTHRIEGISKRVIESLNINGFVEAAECVSPPVPRYSYWNGEKHQANVEHIIQRETFDHGLLKDLEREGIDYRDCMIRHVENDSGKWKISVTSAGTEDLLVADFIVEARGRSAPLSNNQVRKGPASIALTATWRHSRVVTPHVVAASISNGWIWIVESGRGSTYVQLTVDSEDSTLPVKQEIAPFMLKHLEELESAGINSRQWQQPGNELARGSTSILVEDCVSDSFIRVGDAAMTADPLSGNGIFQSLSSALIAPAVVNTVLRRPDQRSMAISFFRDRIRHLYTRLARTGRDFYRLESRYHNEPFWKARRDWPDAEPTHLPEEIIGTEIRPVVCDEFIEERDVLITKDQPLGIWMIDGKPAVT